MLGWVETTTDLTNALGELAPRQRVALVLRYFDDLSEAQVAELMGCSVGTVKSTTSRALERLRAIVTSAYGTERRTRTRTRTQGTDTKECSVKTGTEFEAELSEAFAARAAACRWSRPLASAPSTTGPGNAGCVHRRR